MFWINKIWYCKDCADKFNMLPDLVNLISKYIPKIILDIIYIIRDYCKSPLTLDLIGSKRIQSSVFTDWIYFMSFYDFDSKLIYWFINCNLNSPFYGIVLSFTDKGDLMMGDHIEEFEKKFIKSLKS
jgi:hypothetical protein